MTSPLTLPTTAPVDDVLADLEWRGLLAQTTERAALAADLSAGPVTLYCGFDPTADSLHLGNLVPLLALRRFQLAGHRPIALLGGATGFIGDPTGRTTDRVLLTHETIERRVAVLRAQLAHFLDTAPGPAQAVFADNLDWTRDLSVLDFLRDVGAHFPVSLMLARDSVRTRLASGGLSFTELSYQLLQSMDYVELYRRYGCRLQIGGSDQWGNITAGLDLLRRVEGVDRVRAHALTFPLVTEASGQKIGKSTGGGSVWVDPAMTSPYSLYQYLLNVDDRDVGSYLRLLTLVGRSEVADLDRETAERPQARSAQRRLAREVVALVHGAPEVMRVEEASSALFGRGSLAELDEAQLLAALSEAPSIRTGPGLAGWVDLLAVGLGLSRSDARRALADGGVYVNNARLDPAAQGPAEGDWLYGRLLVLRRGKRSVLVVERHADGVPDTDTGADGAGH